MPDNVNRLAPGKKSMKQANDWLGQRREQSRVRRDEIDSMMEGVQDALENNFGAFGIREVQMGEHTMSIAPNVPSAPPSISSAWSDHLASGGKIWVLEVNNAGTGYWGCENLNPEHHALDELMDTAVVARLAPTATIYGPGQEAPWSSIFNKRGFQIWIKDASELDALWKELPSWVLSKWHDTKTASNKFVFSFSSVARIWISKIHAPDMAWRLSQSVRAQQQKEQQEEMGAWDTHAQAELKRAITALVGLEGHPVLGLQATGLIDQILPALAYSMEGKLRAKSLNAAHNKARGHVRSGVNYFNVAFDAWSPTVPIV